MRHETDFALHTDLYELTMAAAYFAAGVEDVATFELFVRSLPEGRGYLVAAGLGPAVEYLEALRFRKDEIAYLRRQEVLRAAPAAFFDSLRAFRFTGDVWAMPEGTPFFAGEPVLRVTAPIIEAQLVETYLLALIHAQTLVASKAARIVGAAAERDVADFGGRRAHGPEAGVLAARAAVIGGAVGSSNVHAAHRFGLKAVGTMAHSYVMAFDSEDEAFAHYATLFPESAVLLIDTTDTVAGARAAVRLAKKGHRVQGVRLDSGDLAALAREVRAVLDAGGLTDARIVASGDLNEWKIADLVAAGAPIDLFGVGTELVTSRDEPVLGVVYKLVERSRDGRSVHPLKLSADKETLPGVKQVFRRAEGGGVARDLVALADETPGESWEPLLTCIMAGGRAVVGYPTVTEIRERTRREVARLPEGVRRLDAAQRYPVRVSEKLAALAARARSEAEKRSSP
jgi:nicotinate phosphoribosyltransferase